MLGIYIFLTKGAQFSETCLRLGDVQPENAKKRGEKVVEVLKRKVQNTSLVHGYILLELSINYVL